MAGTLWACTRLDIQSVSVRFQGVGHTRGSRRTAKLLGPVLKVGDVRLTPLVGGGILAAPLGGDPPEVAARVLALSVVAHRVQ